MQEPAAPQPADLVTIRPATPEDDNFVLNAALITLRNRSHLSWHVGNSDFFAGEPRILKRLLARSRVLIAHPPDDAELIAGFIVVEPPELVHFLYVKAALRRQGVGRALLRAADLDPERGFVATAATYDLTKGWMHNRWPAIRFNPYPRWE